MTTPIPGPLRLGDLLDRSFRLYRARWSAFLLTAAVFLAPWGILTGLFYGQSVTSLMDAAAATQRSARSAAGAFLGPALTFGGMVALLALLSLLAIGAAVLALTHQSIETLHGRQPSLGEDVRQGLRRLFALIGLALLYLLAVMAATIVAVVPLGVLIALAAAVFDSDQASGNTLVAVGLVLLILFGTLLAFILVLIPTIYLSARWVAALPVLVAEGLGPVQALRRSWQLTRGQIWRCVGYLILLWLLSVIVTSIPVNVLYQFVALALGPDNLGWSTGIASALAQLANIIWLPLQTAALVLLYYDLRVRHEGYDLALRVEQMEAEQSVRGPAIGETPA